MVNLDKILLALDEATVERDEHYYDLAVSFYEKMRTELRANNYQSREDDIVFKGGSVHKDYDDLVVIFSDENGKNDYIFGYAYGLGKHSIGIPNLSEKNNFRPEKGIDKDTFIHEFIHYLDLKRSNGKLDKGSEAKSKVDYYNSPSEINAYYQAAITKLSTFVKVGMKDNIIAGCVNNCNRYDDFWNYLVSDMFPKAFIANLTKENINKLKKRAYTVWEKYFRK